MNRHMDRQTDGLWDMMTPMQVKYRQTDGQIDRQTYGQINRWTD